MRGASEEGTDEKGGILIGDIEAVDVSDAMMRWWKAEVEYHSIRADLCVDVHNWLIGKLPGLEKVEVWIEELPKYGIEWGLKYQVPPMTVKFKSDTVTVEQVEQWAKVLYPSVTVEKKEWLRG